jgi:hypothetical protein
MPAPVEILRQQRTKVITFLSFFYPDDRSGLRHWRERTCDSHHKSIARDKRFLDCLAATRIGCFSGGEGVASRSACVSRAAKSELQFIGTEFMTVVVMDATLTAIPNPSTATAGKTVVQ